jgi:hypothetical protein
MTNASRPHPEDTAIREDLAALSAERTLTALELQAQQKGRAWYWLREPGWVGVESATADDIPERLDYVQADGRGNLSIVTREAVLDAIAEHKRRL